MNELNKKLAEWVGITLVGVPDGCEPQFTESLDACFKWLVPKLDENYAYVLMRDWVQEPKGNEWVKRHFWECEIYPNALLCRESYTTVAQGGGETSSLAFCLAIEKLIDGEK